MNLNTESLQVSGKSNFSFTLTVPPFIKFGNCKPSRQFRDYNFEEQCDIWTNCITKALIPNKECQYAFEQHPSFRFTYTHVHGYVMDCTLAEIILFQRTAMAYAGITSMKQLNDFSKVDIIFDLKGWCEYVYKHQKKEEYETVLCSDVIEKKYVEYLFKGKK